MLLEDDCVTVRPAPTEKLEAAMLVRSEEKVRSRSQTASVPLLRITWEPDGIASAEPMTSVPALTCVKPV